MRKGDVANLIVQQVLGILCLILIWNLVAGPVGVDAINVPPCLGPCSAIPNCHQSCIDHVLIKGSPREVSALDSPLRIWPVAALSRAQFHPLFSLFSL
ncbi:hypothetical protein E1A91_A07G169400v1 [Gossypium mustelinum]|uniref:Uncharacterized protein n=1 Tax=Gossypium mustelinum TaxID=34275 RepID=A0A5D2YMF3_GOSMU|nr:hypothetical protein E1A91_A07G169400v1 [Gossypium mustelinum]